MKKILITGSTGFVGSYLREQLLISGNDEVYGTYHETSKESSSERMHFIQLDLQNKQQIHEVLATIQPDIIYHLAAFASVSASFTNPIETFHANIDSQLTLLDSLRELQLMTTRVLIVSSAEVYGYVRPEDLPIDEKTPLRPTNPYAVSKIAQDYLALQYHLSYNMPLIRVRPFNHIGPGQKTGFVVADFAKQIADIEQGKQEPIIKVGNLNAKRDFTDVRDMVKAYPLVLENGMPGEVYNIGSGVFHKIQEILDMLISFATTPISIAVDPKRYRASDTAEIVADNSKVSTLTGWKPEIPLEKTLKDTLDYWRNIR